MFNLLRMDLYRLKRSRAVYVCLAVLSAMAVLSYWMMWMLETPDGREFAAKAGITALRELEEEDILPEEEYNIIFMFREAGMDGGAYSCVMGLAVALFVCGDFSSGFVKNIMSLHRSRWKYAGSKLMAAGILNFFYIAFLFAVHHLLNLFFQNMFPLAGPADTLFYLTWIWLAATAFSALLILAGILTRSAAAGITCAFLLGSGILVTAVSYVTGMFGLNEWVSYTLYYNITYGPSHYAGMHDLKVYAVGLVFLAVYFAAAASALSRRDI